MKMKGIVFVLALGLLFWLTNPSLERHKQKVNLTVPVELTEEMRKLGASAAVRDLDVEYNNYRLFSTTSSKDNGGKLSLGLVGMVFDLRNQTTQQNAPVKR